MNMMAYQDDIDIRPFKCLATLHAGFLSSVDFFFLFCCLFSSKFTFSKTMLRNAIN